MENREEITVTRSLPADKWCQYIQNELESEHHVEVAVVTVIGKDHPSRKKWQEINDFMCLNAFPSFLKSCSKLDADIFYSRDYSIVFIVINSPNDKLSEFSTGEKINFFDEMTKLDKSFLHSLHIAALVSHALIIMESYPRIDTSIIRTLRNVNSIRLAGLHDVAELIEKNITFFPSQDEVLVRNMIEDGRLFTPRFLMAMQKSMIRLELGFHKRKEIADKLEESLEAQASTAFQRARLIDNGFTSPLGQVCDEVKFIRLLFPSLANETIKSDMLEMLLDKKTEEEEDDERTSDEETEDEADVSTNAFRKLIGQNLTDIKMEIDGCYKLPTLKTVQLFINLLSEQMPEESDIDLLIDKISNLEKNFLNEQTNKIVEETLDKFSYNPDKKNYLKGKGYGKMQHSERLAAAVHYMDGLLIGKREEAMNEFRSKFDSLCQGGKQYCEQESALGNPCTLPAHSSPGDESAPQKEWKLHESGVTFISTCVCGHSQTIRRDPFSVKEANFDFYHQNTVFVCCKSLEKYNFRLVDAMCHEPSDEAWHAEENWPKLESREYFSRRLPRRLRNSSNSDVEIEFQSNSSSSDNEITDDEESVESSDNEEYGGARRTTPHRKASIKEPGDKRLAICEYQKKLKTLEEKNIPHTVGVPHSLTPGILPVFSSWNLTCIGSGSLYNHAYGLRDQPNFKISSEFLLPVDISLLVDRESWEQDLEFVNAIEGGGHKYRAPRRYGIDTEKVKLFIGFDYECTRGHRFFVNASGDPLLLPKNHILRENACREYSVNLMTSDLPLRRQCTCRKQPNQIAQLMKVHIVTPKAPVSITIDPKIFIPDQEGYYCTGEDPLKLDWARYYILHLPHVYSGPHGLWIPPKIFDKVGIFKGNSIQVSYIPLGKK